MPYGEDPNHDGSPEVVGSGILAHERHFILQAEPWMLIEENPKTALSLFSLFTVLLVLGCTRANSDPDNTPEIELHDPLTIMTPPNQLTEEETSEGFELLFDGASLHRWRGYGCDRVPAGWTATGGTIAFAPDVE
ncbi:uncharacterized protein METZ01_LOCUS440938, partial [marine metagenome]